MINKNQIIVFSVSLLIVGSFVFSAPEAAFSGAATGGPPCCQVPNSCTAGETEDVCVNTLGGQFFPNAICPDTEGDCVELAPQIPTLTQWGTIIMAGVLGLFAVIGLIAMRSGVAKPSKS